MTSESDNEASGAEVAELLIQVVRSSGISRSELLTNLLGKKSIARRNGHAGMEGSIASRAIDPVRYIRRKRSWKESHGQRRASDPRIGAPIVPILKYVLLSSRHFRKIDLG